MSRPDQRCQNLAITPKIRQNTEAIDKKVVPVVFPENLDLTGCFAERPAVEEENELDTFAWQGWKVEEKVVVSGRLSTWV